MTPAELRALLSEVLGVPAGEIHSGLEFGGIEAWDSLGHTELMLALEEKLELEIGPERIVELTNMSALERFVAHPVEERSPTAPGAFEG